MDRKEVTMIKAVVSNGVIVPRDPMPHEWIEGTEVQVDTAPHAREGGNDLDRWFAELQALAAQGDPEDDRRLDEAIRSTLMGKEMRDESCIEKWFDPATGADSTGLAGGNRT